MCILKIRLHGNGRRVAHPCDVNAGNCPRVLEDACGADRVDQECGRVRSAGLEAVGEGGVAASGAGGADGGGEGFAGADED